jgi:hypothetical protein
MDVSCRSRAKERNRELELAGEAAWWGGGVVLGVVGHDSDVLPSKRKRKHAREVRGPCNGFGRVSKVFGMEVGSNACVDPDLFEFMIIVSKH